MDRKTEPPRGNRAFKESGGQAIHKSHPLISLAQGEENTWASITMLGGENGAEADGTGKGVCVCIQSLSRNVKPMSKGWGGEGSSRIKVF